MTETIRRVLEQYDNLTQYERAEVVELAQLIDRGSDSFGFCMSSEGDTLSQWRGYADDGRGVSVGFNTDFLTAMAKSVSLVSLQQVVYNVAEQDAVVIGKMHLILELISKGAVRPPQFLGGLLSGGLNPNYEQDKARFQQLNSQLFMVLASFSRIWFAFKNPAFREENEWRLTLPTTSSQVTEYRTVNGRLVPYAPLPFVEIADIPVIDEIVLGPKHPTPVKVIEAFLRAKGFAETTVRLSDASYR